MTSPPETDREYAYFRVTGPQQPQAVTKALCIDPDSAWAAGETFERGGRRFQRRSMQWRLDSGLSDRDRLSHHVGVLLDRMEGCHEGLTKLSASCRLQIVCVGFYYQAFSWELDFELQKRATDLGIGFWFDFYPFGDLHEELCELRDAVGRLRAE